MKAKTASKPPVKPSVIHRHNMLNEAFVDDDIDPSPISERDCGTSSASEDEKFGGNQEINDFQEDVMNASRNLDDIDVVEQADEIYENLECLNTEASNNNEEPNETTSQKVYENVTNNTHL